MSAKAGIVRGLFGESSFHSFGLERDLIATGNKGAEADSIVWTHRTGSGFDIYFVSNQGAVSGSSMFPCGAADEHRNCGMRFRETVNDAKIWRFEKGRTVLPLQLEGSGSIFIVLQKRTRAQEKNGGKNWAEAEAGKRIDGVWRVQFDTAFGGPVPPAGFFNIN